MSEERAKELGLKPRARIIASSVAAIRPEIMGLGPIPAVEKVLAQAGMTIDDIDVLELNEAFAAQVVPCRDEWGIDPEKLNPFGGAIALGHPFGMTGARIMTTLLNNLDALDGTIGLETMCVAGGMGQAMVMRAAELSLRSRAWALFVCMGNICRSPTAEGVMRHLLREAGARGRDRDRQRGHGRVARRQPARPRARRPPPARAGSRSRAPRGRSARATSRTSTCCWPPTARTSPTCARSRRTRRRARRCGCCATSTRLARRPRRARPLLRRAGRLRGGARPRRGGLPRAARRGAVSLEAELGAAAGSPVASSRRVAGGSINEAYAVEFEDGRRAFVKTRPDAPDGRVRGRGGGAGVARRAGRRCACPR